MLKGDLAARMVSGIDHYLMKRLGEARRRRDRYWNCHFASPRQRERFRTENRREFRRIIGAVDARVAFDSPALVATLSRPALVATGAGYRVYAIRWPVLEGVDGEGLLLRPRGRLRGNVVALPDADWTPEMLAGLARGIPPPEQFARRLAESGFQVVVPVLVSRSDRFSGKRGVAFTNQPQREFLYRMAYEMGRHIIGYEVEKVLAAVDWFRRSAPGLPVGVAGYGEGGLLALDAAAVDPRIDAALVSGYFEPREDVWREPIYRNVWSQLERFGDAELAGLIAPRPLVVEASPQPEVAGPPPPTKERYGAAPGRLTTPPGSAVRAEFARARRKYARLGAAGKIHLVVAGPGSPAALRAFLAALGPGATLAPEGPAPRDRRANFDPVSRQRRQFQQLVNYTQRLVRQSPRLRKKFFSRADSSSVARWEATTKPYRRWFWEEIIGRMPPPSEPPRARTRLVSDTSAYRGYEVILPVWPGMFASGILLVPKDLEPGERRPVVVCQHGLEGRARDVIDPPSARLRRVYARFGARLAAEGFVVYAPQNPYIGHDHFRVLQRKANPQKLSLFSFIVGQHRQTLAWLATLPFVDSRRIGFYGLSYGGKTALRVPAILTRYALSICSGDFNEWTWKITDLDHRFSYLYTVEYDVLEFNLGNTFDHAEMAGLIAPRPFMVERGHRDGVSIDEWVAYEYAPVRRLYDALGIGGRTRIEFFNGPHQIHGVGTFEFLRRFLHWPR